MDIKPLEIRLVTHREPLLAFVSVLLDDCLEIHGLKVIRGVTGLFVAMPQNRVQDSCEKCKKKNSLQSRFCHWCGTPLGPIDKRAYVVCPNLDCRAKWPEGYKKCQMCNGSLPERGMRYENVCSFVSGTDFKEKLHNIVLEAYLDKTGGVT